MGTIVRFPKQPVVREPEPEPVVVRPEPAGPSPAPKGLTTGQVSLIFAVAFAIFHHLFR